VKVLITGSAGMVGQALLRTAPPHVKVLAPQRSELELRNRLDVESYLTQNQPDGIIFASARVGGIATNASKQLEFLQDNLRIQESVLGLAGDLGVPNFIFLGSSCIYPRLAEQPIKESSLLSGPLEPTNEGYALAKIAGVRMCQAICDQKSLNFMSLMPTNLYGPFDNYDLQTSHVPAALIRRFHEAKMSGVGFVKVWGTGSPRREFMHVDDLAHACWFFLGHERVNERNLINIGTGVDLEIREFATLIAEFVGFSGEIIFDSSRPDGMPKKLLDVSLANRLGWQSTIDLDKGLRETYNIFQREYSEGTLRGI
jgi:GDP-L-fucose synthase